MKSKKTYKRPIEIIPRDQLEKSLSEIEKSILRKVDRNAPKASKKDIEKLAEEMAILKDQSVFINLFGLGNQVGGGVGT